jgi:hypothetical protein
VIGHVPKRVPYGGAARRRAADRHPAAADLIRQVPAPHVRVGTLDDARLEMLIAESKRSKIAITPTLVTIDRPLQRGLRSMLPA